MPEYRVEVRPAARKAIDKLDKPIRRRVLRALVGLESDPRPNGVVALKKLPGHLRIRVGDYRVVYVVRDEEVLILVVAVGHRSEIYREMSS